MTPDVRGFVKFNLLILGFWKKVGETGCSMGFPHMLHVWYIYLHLTINFRPNVGKYSIHGAFGVAEWAKSRKKTCGKVDQP